MAAPACLGVLSTGSSVLPALSSLQWTLCSFESLPEPPVSLNTLALGPNESPEGLLLSHQYPNTCSCLTPRRGHIFSIASLDLASSLQQSLKEEAPGAMRFPTSLCNSVWGSTLRFLCQTQSCRTQIARGFFTPSWHRHRTHITLCSGDWGLVPLPLEVGALYRGC